MPIRPRRRSIRPADEPIFTRPVGMDFEKRKITFPPGFIKEIVLKGGDEYVTADDLVTIVSAISIEFEDMMKLLKEISDKLD